jgi:DNA-binding MarR family transcriptional regulator
VEKAELTDKEKLMLYGLTKYPILTDKQLSEKLDLKHSTVTAIRHRLRKNEFFRGLAIPRLQNMGCNMLVLIYTALSPLIPLEERVIISGKTIAVFEEIFLSIGAQDKGFSLSLSKDYATIGRINDIRTQTFGKHGFLEDEYPNMVVFPFDISKIYRFFDFSPLLKKSFDLDIDSTDEVKNLGFLSGKNVSLTDREKKIYCSLIQHPEISDINLGKKIGVSRHTVSRIRRNFEKDFLIRWINLPNLKKLGFEILTTYHISYDPRNHPNMEEDETVSLISDSTIMMASRMFETFMLCVHSDFDDYNRDTNRIMQILKEKKWISKNPAVRTYSLNELIYIKDFIFAPIAKKILEKSA